jgi:hypothetical protein
MCSHRWGLLMELGTATVIINFLQAFTVHTAPRVLEAGLKGII